MRVAVCVDGEDGKLLVYLDTNPDNIAHFVICYDICGAYLFII